MKLTSPEVGHIRALSWAVEFAQRDLGNPDQINRAKAELFDFIEGGGRVSRIKSYQSFDVMGDKTEFVQSVDDERLKEVQQKFASTFSFIIDHAAMFVMLEKKDFKRAVFLWHAESGDGPFNQALFIVGDVESQAVASIGVHLAGSGLTADRILKCARCQKIFLRPERKPEKGKPAYCSPACAHAVAVGAYQQRQKEIYIKTSATLRKPSSVQPAKKQIMRRTVTSMAPEELKRRREKLEMTQDELASRLKVNVMTVSRWERGTVKIPYKIELALKQIERQSR